MIKTFEEWCREEGIKIEEVSINLLPTAYRVWGEECYYEAKELKAENAALRERLERSVELPCIRECNADTHLIEVCWLTKYGTIHTQLFHEDDVKSAEACLAEKKGQK